MLFLAGAEILCAYVHDAVCIDVEGDFNLRNTTRSRRNADEVESAERTVLVGHFAFALKDVDAYCRLAVCRCRAHLALLCRNSRVAVDESGEHTAHRLDAE